MTTRGSAPGLEVEGAEVTEDDAEGGTDRTVPVARSRRRRSRIPLVSAVVVGCLAALLVAVLATSKSASQNETVVSTPLQDKPAPNISGPLLNGGNANLDSYRGKWVLVNFFASWCVPCQQEQNDLVKFQNTNAADLVIFGVRFDDPDVGPLNQMMSKSGAHWPVVDDPNAKIDYSVTGPPESFLVSPNGIVLVHIVGAINDPQLEQILGQAKLVVTTEPSATSVPAASVPAASVPAASVPAASTTAPPTTAAP